MNSHSKMPPTKSRCSPTRSNGAGWLAICARRCCPLGRSATATRLVLSYWRKERCCCAARWMSRKRCAPRNKGQPYRWSQPCWQVTAAWQRCKRRSLSGRRSAIHTRNWSLLHAKPQQIRLANQSQPGWPASPISASSTRPCRRQPRRMNQLGLTLPYSTPPALMSPSGQPMYWRTLTG